MSRTHVSNEAKPSASAHTFHIPVMGTGFTVDSALRVVPLGISSVISLVDDILLEQVRAYHCKQRGIPFTPVPADHPDGRAARITAYLDFVDAEVRKASGELQAGPFEPGSPITQYFELLPDTPLKRRYEAMCATADDVEKQRLQAGLRSHAVPGRIDVNIMTKLDCENYRNGEKRETIYNDGMAALRGYAQSTLTNSAVVFSAGLNARLYSYAAEFGDFFADAAGYCRKQIILKVSDFRSAVIQGRFFAKRGLWVSEFRVESGLNCGGHTFPTAGSLLGPILQEFKDKRDELGGRLHRAHNSGRQKADMAALDTPPPLRITVQGGIGSVSENDLMLTYYNMDATGWGTPFLLVPDVTEVDEEHLSKLINCAPDDVYLSDSSPMGVPYWNLRTSGSEDARRERIEQGRPGSPCVKGFLRFDDSLTRIPACKAAREFQRPRLARIDAADIPPEQKEFLRQDLLHKSCICHDLGGSLLRKFGIDPKATPAICCGPNTPYFKKIMSLDELVGYIYGRISGLCHSDRPHMFIQELRIYVQHLRDQMSAYSIGVLTQAPEYFDDFRNNLIEGIQYYRTISRHIVDDQRERFLAELSSLQEQIEAMRHPQPQTCT